MKPLTQNVAEISVVYQPTQRLKPTISSSKDAFTELSYWFPSETISLQERFVVAYLNRSNVLLGVYHLSSGGITGTVADTRLILATALKVAACGLILAHNHPSSNLKPSKQDEALTCKIKQAASYMDIQLVDHLIISPDQCFFSFADQGLL